MAHLYRAAWVVPIAVPPIRRGWVAVEHGRIVSVGTAGSNPPSDIVETIDLGAAALLPGLVNAHTHLELSWMRDQVPPAASMPAWAARLMALRRMVSAEPPDPIVAAVREVRAAGTSLVGDVTNTLAAYEPLADSDLAGALFRELLGFSAPAPVDLVASVRAQLDELMPIAWLRPSIVPHAPYSVSPELFRAIAAVSGDRPMSVHLGESAEEVQFLREGTGAWRELLAELGVWSDRWIPPGCGPVEYLERLGLVGPHLLAVHGTQFTRDDLACLAAAGGTVVTCPRSNQWTGAGIPPVEEFYASGVRVAIGTDSLASVPDLNPFAELAEVRRLAPRVPASMLLASATLHGATALGFAADYGTVEPGKLADLIAIRLPKGMDDVEEYLVGGIEPDAVSWLPEPEAP
jgi:cytosine/adenosine deaminase-related metal-dependent hydrolase